MNKTIYAEVGIGNSTLFSTEIEEGANEHRIPGFHKPKSIEGYYLRLWLFNRVLILSTFDGIKIQRKNKYKLKILFGINGH